MVQTATSTFYNRTGEGGQHLGMPCLFPFLPFLGLGLLLLFSVIKGIGGCLDPASSLDEMVHTATNTFYNREEEKEAKAQEREKRKETRHPRCWPPSRETLWQTLSPRRIRQEANA